jgi:hypothetical protein
MAPVRALARDEDGDIGAVIMKDQGATAGCIGMN